MNAESAPIFRSLAEIAEWRRGVGSARVVLAHGCFDPLHVGHVRFLRGAKSEGDCLIVAVSDDNLTRALKGDDRPVVPADDRLRVVAGLDVVDAVLCLSAAEVSTSFEILAPDAYATGTDHEESLPDKEVLRSLDIDVVVVGAGKSHSSTDVVRWIRSPKGSGGKST